MKTSRPARGGFCRGWEIGPEVGGAALSWLSPGSLVALVASCRSLPLLAVACRSLPYSCLIARTTRSSPLEANGWSFKLSFLLFLCGNVGVCK